MLSREELQRYMALMIEQRAIEHAETGRAQSDFALAGSMLDAIEQEGGWTPPMSEASAAAYAEGEFWRIMEGQHREDVHEPDV